MESYRLPLSISCPRTIEAIHLLASEVVSGTVQSNMIQKILKGNEEIFFLHVLHAFEELSKGSLSGREEAQKALKKAALFFSWSNEWEQSFFDIGNFILKRKYTQALSFLERHLLEWPYDLLALKCVEKVVFLRGENADPKWFEKIVERCYFSCRENPYYCGLYARALYTNGKQAYAKDFAEKGVQSSVGIQTLIDIYIQENRITDAKQVAQEHKNLFGIARCALLENQILDAKHAAEEMFAQSSYLQEIIRCIALFLHIEVYEIPINWKEVRAHIPQDFDPFFSPLATAFQCIVLHKTVNNIDRYVSKIHKETCTLCGEERTIWDKIGIPLLYAVQQAAEGTGRPLQELLTHNPYSTQIGGSAFERDAFLKLSL